MNKAVLSRCREYTRLFGVIIVDDNIIPAIHPHPKQSCGSSSPQFGGRLPMRRFGIAGHSGQVNLNALTHKSCSETFQHIERLRTLVADNLLHLSNEIYGNAVNKSLYEAMVASYKNIIDSMLVEITITNKYPGLTNQHKYSEAGVFAKKKIDCKRRGPGYAAWEFGRTR